MKTKLFTLCFVSLLVCACDDKSNTSAASAASQRGTRDGVLLTTDLPPEIIEGTQFPIILPLRTPGS
jgi:hypothetical protein